MQEITGDNAAEYLRRTGRARPTEAIEARELPDGVSNVVFRVALPARGEQFVLKQARERLRVKEEWRCPVDRIWHEVEALRACHKIVAARPIEAPAAVVPQILWEDRANFVYAMTAAPPEHQTWKHLLLAGDFEVSRPLAVACGRMMGQLQAGSWLDRDLAPALYDRTYFEQLRLDPYYRRIAQVHPDLAKKVEQLIDSVWQHRRCLVHGDFSPKNLLVWPGHVMLIDFEVGHYGDPAFDVGFFLTHLLLKAVWSGEDRGEYVALADEFWTAYRSTLAPAISSTEMASLEQRMLWNLAGCILARVDGKSPVEYLNAEQQQIARDLGRQWIKEPPASWREAISVWRSWPARSRSRSRQ